MLALDAPCSHELRTIVRKTIAPPTLTSCESPVTFSSMTSRGMARLPIPWLFVLACAPGDDARDPSDGVGETSAAESVGGPTSDDTGASSGPSSTDPTVTSGPTDDSASSDDGTPTCDATSPDEDADGICDALDNCPDVANPDQAITPDNELGDACMWPNQISFANSDPWIAEHHDDLRRMAPRFLAINFANGIGLGGNDNTDGGPLTQQDLEARAQGFVDAMRESSRFHGYQDAAAPAFLDPRLVDVVDLSDDNGHANSELFPRGAIDAQGRPRVGYWRLFEPDFAEHLGVFDDQLGRYLTLGELVQRGDVHEVIMMANQVDGTPANPVGQVTLNILEVAFVAQAYDAELTAIPGAYVKNGIAFDQQLDEDPSAPHDNSMPWSAVGRSLRIYFLNVQRGSGCLQHSLGHEFEFRYNESRIYAPGQPWDGASSNPYMQPLFRAFADFDMAARYGTPFDSLYAAGDGYSYTDCGSGACTTLVTSSGSVPGYAPRCGNTHYPPGATQGYDYYPTAAVPSTCESFASDAAAAPSPSDPSRWSALPVDDDCGGKFLTWWYQNMPGLGATGTDPSGQPLRNWWPFMYY